MRENPLRNATEVLDRIEHATVATVTADGRPWNTPVYFARRHDSLYWISAATLSIPRTSDDGHAFIAVFDSSREDSSGAGAYFEADVAELTTDDDIQGAVELIYRRRNKPVPSASHFSGGSLHAVYHAQAARVWTNMLHTSSEIPWDERVEISLPLERVRDLAQCPDRNGLA